MQEQHKQSNISFRILKDKYFSTQIYYYSHVINDIVLEKEVRPSINFQDLHCLVDVEEYLKRWYAGEEFKSKISIFKEYYFYHEDCPRIHMQNIENAYGKWHDRKRDMIYRKLKVLYHEHSLSESQENTINANTPISHFLLNISEYNPFSKKYYLRIQAKKQKELREKKEQKTEKELSKLNHELSEMLNEIHDLSEISIYPSKKEKKWKTQIKKLNDPTTSTSQEMSQNYSNPYSTIKLNFRKNKLTLSNKNSAQKVEEIHKSSSAKKKLTFNYNKQSSSKEKNMEIRESGKISPKMGQMRQGLQSLKTKSIYSVSSFGSLKVNQKQKRNVNREKEFLKLNLDTNSKLVIKKKEEGRYKSQKVEDKRHQLPVKVKSNGKLVPSPELQKIRKREESKKKIQTKPDQFCDNKILVHQEQKMRSHKSEFTKNPIIVSNSSSKKNLFQIKNARQDFMNKMVTKKQKILEIKNN